MSNNQDGNPTDNSGTPYIFSDDDGNRFQIVIQAETDQEEAELAALLESGEINISAAVFSNEDFETRFDENLKNLGDQQSSGIGAIPKNIPMGSRALPECTTTIRIVPLQESPATNRVTYYKICTQGSNGSQSDNISREFLDLDLAYLESDYVAVENSKAFWVRCQMTSGKVHIGILKKPGAGELYRCYVTIPVDTSLPAYIFICNHERTDWIVSVKGVLSSNANEGGLEIF